MSDKQFLVVVLVLLGGNVVAGVYVHGASWLFGVCPANYPVFCIEFPITMGVITVAVVAVPSLGNRVRNRYVSGGRDE